VARLFGIERILFATNFFFSDFSPTALSHSLSSQLGQRQPFPLAIGQLQHQGVFFLSLSIFFFGCRHSYYSFFFSLGCASSRIHEPFFIILALTSARQMMNLQSKDPKEVFKAPSAEDLRGKI
jgi:hypothetical protein